MATSQREQNPDVNTYRPENESGEDSGTGRPSDSSDNIEKDQDSIPLPPDSPPAAPVEEPPGADGPPVGDVDDSPKRIA